MLDTIIIDSLRRQREEQRDERPRLYIEPPPIREPEPTERRPATDEGERGVAEIDFTV